MAGSKRRYCSLLLIAVVTVVCGNEDISDVSQLKADLREKSESFYIHNLVKKALTRILGDKYYESVRNLRHNQQQMKRYIHSMERRLKTLEDDRNEKTRTIERLQKEHQKGEVRMEDLQGEVNSSQLHVSNVYSELKQEANSTQFKLDDIEDNFSKILNNVTLLRKFVDNKMDNISRYCSCVDKTMSSTDTSLTYPPTPVTTVTPRVVEEMNRILVIQRYSSTVHPHQIDLHSNEMSTYTYLQTSRITSSTYDPISRRIIFSRYRPHGIYSSRLDVGGVETVKLNVGSEGMVVDVDRGLVFLTTSHPGLTISRMTTTGNDFRVVVDLTGKISYPRGIALDGRQRVIYFCAHNRLLSVDYAGKNLRTLQRGGRRIYTVIFDESRGSVFFNVDKKVMMKSLATDRNTEIMELGYRSWKFALYNNSLYVSGYSYNNIGVIHLESNTYSNLKNMEHDYNDIILVP